MGPRYFRPQSQPEVAAGKHTRTGRLFIYFVRDKVAWNLDSSFIEVFSGFLGFFGYHFSSENIFGYFRFLFYRSPRAFREIFVLFESDVRLIFWVFSHYIWIFHRNNEMCKWGKRLFRRLSTGLLVSCAADFNPHNRQKKIYWADFHEVFQFNAMQFAWVPFRLFYVR